MAGILFTSALWGNLGLRLGDGESDVLDRRENLRQSLSLPALVFMNQTHSSDVVQVSSSDSTVDADAIFTTEKGLGLAVLVGDCVPILLKSKDVVAAVHAGRIGMTNGIVEKTISAMRNLGSSDIEAILGPSICSDCYEVSAQMYHEIIADHPESATKDVKRSLNLQMGIAAQLTDLGVETLNLGICTREHSEFFSHRRSQFEGSPEGRQVGVISL